LRARISGRDKSVGVSVSLKLDADCHRILRLAAQRSGWLVGHFDNVWSLDYHDAIADRCGMRKLAGQKSGELCFDDSSLSNKLNGVMRVQLTQCVKRSCDSCLGRVIATHGVQRDARQFLRFPGCYSLFTIVVSAFFADVVRALHALAARTLLDRDSRSCLVRVACALFSLGCTALWNGHF
jgi:hypothetical protein